ncbi:MAG: hypothetical protein ACC661_03230 [Verrucomicrobiales bacterium]
MDYADTARLAHVNRARSITQIMNLLLLAPDILFLPRANGSRAPHPRPKKTKTVLTFQYSTI